MRRARRLAIGAMAVCGLLGIAAALAAALGVGASSRPGWRRVFFDDFSHGLRTSRWGVYSGQPGGDPGGWWAPSHAVVAHGVLNLETYRDPRYRGRWVSAGVSSAPALRQTYGKYEVRVRMDRGRGVAFVALLWPVHDVWPPGDRLCGKRRRNHRSGSAVTATLHYGADNSQLQRTVEWT